MASRRIPLFELFGEEGSSDDTEFIHLEDIQSRSSRYNWEISPHAHARLFQAVIVQEGEVVASLDGRRIKVAGPVVILLPPGVVHAFQFQTGTVGHVLTVAEDILVGAAPDHVKPLAQALCDEACTVSLHHATEVAARIGVLIAQLAEEFHNARPGRALMFDWLVRAILMLAQRELLQAGETPELERSRTRTYSRFLQMVEQRYLQHWTVPRYAQGLGITEGQLNRLCRKFGGKSAAAIVRERMLREARRKLIYIAAPVTDLAYELGYDDPSYFCRFFKKNTGQSPAEFRASAGR